MSWLDWYVDLNVMTDWLYGFYWTEWVGWLICRFKCEDSWLVWSTKLWCTSVYFDRPCVEKEKCRKGEMPIVFNCVLMWLLWTMWIELGIFFSFIYGVVYLAGVLGITTCCASFGNTRLIGSSFGSTRLI